MVDFKKDKILIMYRYISVDLLKNKRSSFLFVLVCCSAFMIGACPANGKEIVVPSLPYLETLIHTSSSIQAEIALLEELQAELQHQYEDSGWKVIGSVNGGYSNEVRDDNSRDELFPVRIMAGLSYPLFGKYMDERSQLLDMQGRADNRYLHIEIERRKILKKLRTSYIVLWSAEQKHLLAETFLQQYLANLQILKERKNKGLILPSDYYDFITIQDRVVRERRENQNKILYAREVIRILTGVKLSSSLIGPPVLPRISTDLEKHIAELVQNPEVILFQNMVDLQRKKAKYSNSDIKGSLAIQGFASSSDEVNTDSGYGGMISLDLEMPLNPFAASRSTDVLSRKRQKRYQKELDMKMDEVTFELHQYLQNYDFTYSRRFEAIAQLQAATALLKEKSYRLEQLDGDVIAQHQQARYRYYRAAYSTIEAERDNMLAINDMAAISQPEGEKNISTLITSVIKPFTPNSDRSKAVLSEAYLDSPLSTKIESKDQNPNSTEVSFKAPAKTAVYIWKSEAWLRGELLVEDVKKHNINKVLISLDSAQLKYIDTAQGKEQLTSTLAHWRRSGLNISLLLGEPSWILPKYRADLMSILRLANNFRFNSVHLDMEPNQLEVEKYGLEYLSTQLLNTLQLAVNVSQHPIEASFNPQLFKSEASDLCFLCGLENIHLHRVVIMDYRTDHKQVKKQILSIVQQFPQLKLALAQSVEPILTSKNSYFHTDETVFRERMEALQSDSRNENWSGDIYIQDWTAYRQQLNNSTTQ